MNYEEAINAEQTSSSVSAQKVDYKTIIIFVLLGSHIIKPGFYFLVFGIIELVTNQDERMAYFDLSCNSQTKIC